jgi:predicted MFS family arabinose efflux permease
VRTVFTGLWRQPDFRKLWTAQTVSQFGSYVGWVALQFTAVLWLRATPLQISLLTLCQIVPGFFLGLGAGVWTDRISRRPLLIAADLGRALTLGTIPLAALLHLLHMPQLYLVALLTSALTVLFDVASEAFLPSIVEREQLVEGNSKLTASTSVAEFAGFSLGGWLVQLVRGPLAILVDAASFLWSAVWIAQIGVTGAIEHTDEERERFWREALDGLRFLRQQPLLRALAATTAIMQFFSRGIVGTLILLYLVRDAGFGAGALGLIFAVGGLSSLIGAILAGRAHRAARLGPVMAAALIACGAGVIFIPLVRSVSLFGIACLVANQLITDPSWAVYSINEVSLRQALTPTRLQGRISASVRCLKFGAILLGTLAAGVLGQSIGLRATLWVAAAGTLLGGVWLLNSPVFALRHLPEGETRDANAEVMEADRTPGPFPAANSRRK